MGEWKDVLMLTLATDMIMAAQKLFVKCEDFIDEAVSLGIDKEEAEAFKDKWLEKTYKQGMMISECVKNGMTPEETLAYVKERDGDM